MPHPASPRLDVVGIGEDGWDGLTEPQRRLLAEADLVVGGGRQLQLVAGRVRATEAWPSPLLPGLHELVERHRGRRLAVLASGDPMLHGIGSTLVRELGADAVEVHPHISSVALACARLRWPTDQVIVVSAVARPLAAVARWLAPGVRLLVLTSDPDGAERLAALLCDRGYGASGLTVLQRLGGPAEQLHTGHAAGWPANQPHDRLAVVAVECRLSPGAIAWPASTALPDEAYDSDGVMTKQPIRALTLAALAPKPGELLWDVGAGSGTVAVEWVRAAPGCRALAIEPREDRRKRIAVNAEALGATGVQVVAGTAPEALDGLARPQAVFVGGGLTTEGVLQRCLDALSVGGRLVANAVTTRSEAELMAWHERLGGELTRIQLARAEPVGGFSAFRPALPVTQWSYHA